MPLSKFSDKFGSYETPLFIISEDLEQVAMQWCIDKSKEAQDERNSDTPLAFFSVNKYLPAGTIMSGNAAAVKILHQIKMQLSPQV